MSHVSCPAALNLYEVWTVSLVAGKLEMAIFKSSLPPLNDDPDINLLLDILTNISHLLIVTNSVVNIIIYALKARVFTLKIYLNVKLSIMFVLFIRVKV